MAKPQNTQSIEQATDISWDEWKNWLDMMNAFELSHQEIAGLVFSKIEKTVDSPAWWSQGITVAYEQAIARRLPGQRSDGTFEMNLSRGIGEDRKKLFIRCKHILNKYKSLNDFQITNPRYSETTIRSNWRCDFSDGSKMIWSVDQKTLEKSQIVIRQTNLVDNESSAQWKEFWKKFLDDYILKKID